MSSKRLTIKELASEVDMDLDEALVKIWDAGLNEISSENSLIPARKINLAKAVLGISSKKELTQLKFWREKLAMDDEEFIVLAESLGIHLSLGQRKLPKGAVGKLRRYSKSRNISLGIKPMLISERKDNIDYSEDYSLPKIGCKELPVYLELDEVNFIHECLVKDFMYHDDPISPPGVKIPDLLESAVYRQKTSFGDTLKYETPELAGAALTHSLVNNHAFHNGNKRTALVCLLVFLEKNGIVMTCTQQEIFKFILQIAQHGLVNIKYSNLADREVGSIAEWIVFNSRKIENGDRTTAWRRLERILKSYECNIEVVSGNKARIMRTRRMKRYFNLKQEKLQTVVFVPFAGGDVQVATIKKIRNDLKLNDDYGIDSRFFYEKEPQRVDDFINAYRKTLYRLAKL